MKLIIRKLIMMKRSSSVLLLVLGLVMVIGLTACSEKGTVDDGRLKVAVTIEVEKAFVEAIAGDLVEVVTLVPKGASPETYEATPLEIEKYKDSDIFFAMELPVENSKNIPTGGNFITVNLAEAVREKYEDRNFAPGSRDHHTWVSPKRAMVMVDKIASTLIEQDPVNKDIYQNNKEKYLKELEQLDMDIKSMFQDKSQKTFLIYHPALGYFADDYGLEMLAFEEEGKEAEPKQIGDLIDLARLKGIKGILTTEEISSKQVDAFAEEIGGKVIVVKILTNDYIGAMEKIGEEIEGLLR